MQQRGCIFLIYKAVIQINEKIPMENWAKEVNRLFIEERQ